MGPEAKYHLIAFVSLCVIGVLIFVSVKYGRHSSNNQNEEESHHIQEEESHHEYAEVEMENRY